MQDGENRVESLTGYDIGAGDAVRVSGWRRYAAEEQGWRPDQTGVAGSGGGAGNCL
ncbi:MAG: hypothetical protein R3E79_24350 [Caldilineaceae bacterium]